MSETRVLTHGEYDLYKWPRVCALHNCLLLSFLNMFHDCWLRIYNTYGRQKCNCSGLLYAEKITVL